MDAVDTSSGAVRLLRRNAAFRALWLSRTTSFIGDALGTIALLLYIVGERGQVSPSPSCSSPSTSRRRYSARLTGTLSDRVDRKRLMIVSDLLQGVDYHRRSRLPMLPLPLLLVLVAIRSTLGSRVPARVTERRAGSCPRRDHPDRQRADWIWHARLRSSSGPLHRCRPVAVLRCARLLLADAATFGVSALLLLRLPPLAPVSGR